MRPACTSRLKARAGLLTRARARRLLDGGTLSDRLDFRKRMPERDVRVVARRLLETLADMADLGISHMDVKPSNMGLAKFLKLETCTLFDMGSWRRTSETLHIVLWLAVCRAQRDVLVVRH